MIAKPQSGFGRFAKAMLVVHCNELHERQRADEPPTPAAITKYVPVIATIYICSDRRPDSRANRAVTALFKTVCAPLARGHWLPNCISNTELDSLRGCLDCTNDGGI
jgi:hypothetical protein